MSCREHHYVLNQGAWHMPQKAECSEHLEQICWSDEAIFSVPSCHWLKHR